ncbi:unnamed protein product [Protopolystoma xenopodis]|uniref:Rab GDP dissociation inhibitor n=1 Tax=Protopolystoma xenopodis TaxID=117903 RepID=A0A3S5CPJ6_9PLAT|nr:unnamed protein product [Protopolystoma xenopodis]
MCVSYANNVCSKPYFIATVATSVETNSPKEELNPGLSILGSIEKIFFAVSDLYEPTDDGRASRLFISSSYDATTHFETTCTDVLNIYERITSTPFDFTKVSSTIETTD